MRVQQTRDVLVKYSWLSVAAVAPRSASLVQKCLELCRAWARLDISDSSGEPDPFANEQPGPAGYIHLLCRFG